MFNQNQVTMKTKIFFMLCLLLGIATTQLFAQPPIVPDGTKSVSFRFELTVPFWTPLYCNGELVDIVGGTLKFHHIWHYADGTDLWCIYQCEGELTGQNTGEVFKYKESGRKHFHYDNCFVTFHYNALGDQGNHLVGTMTWNFCSDPNMENLIIDKAVCN
jgi:hypothetical protein